MRSASCAKAYLQIRTNIAKSIGPLIITHRKPYRPASSDKISHWIKDKMVSSGIYNDVFTAHSCRAAVTSKTQLTFPVEGKNIKVSCL